MLKHCSLSHHIAIKRQRGTTLIEALVAILILSIGLLGIAGLQASTLKYSQGGWARAAVASNLSDIADRIRTNPSTTTTAYRFTTDYTAQRSAIDLKTVTAALDCESESTSTGVTCTADQLATYQLVRWRLALARDLPGGAGYITGTRDTGYVATVIWLDKTNFDDASTSVKTNTLKTPAACAGTESGIAARTCCPSAASAPAGARCTNLLVTP
jgi:type IV pilus assembly protein PilV